MKVNWVKNEDHNINFFHKYASQRRANVIKELEKEDETSITNPNKMASITKEYFATLFNSVIKDEVMKGLESVSKGITRDMNEMLKTSYTVEEIVSALRNRR